MGRICRWKWAGRSRPLWDFIMLHRMAHILKLCNCLNLSLCQFLIIRLYKICIYWLYKGFHFHMSIHAYNVIWSKSAPLLLFRVSLPFYKHFNGFYYIFIHLQKVLWYIQPLIAFLFTFPPCWFSPPQQSLFAFFDD
jgi:hypothetical protein